MAKKTRDFSDADFSAYSSTHLLYEMHMLVGCASLFGCDILASDSLTVWAFSNSRVESFAIHVRNLIDFLYPRGRPCDTDVTAADFMPAGTELEPISPTLQAARRRADKEIAHLTTSRLEDGDPGKLWHVSLVHELFSVLREFVDAAMPTRLGTDVREFIQGGGAQKWAQSAEREKEGNSVTH
ncbi:MAG TPA: hypothetical protein VD837_09605 [Terriglobales bacterium]|nr:hypothetical protein [Terriglobales bacterium]